MSIEEVIAKLEEMADDREDKILPGCLGWDEIEPLRKAIALLKTHRDNQPNEPLTVDELQEMIGQPVYYPDIEGWKIVDEFAIRAVFCDGAKLYRRPPKEETP